MDTLNTPEKIPEPKQKNIKEVVEKQRNWFWLGGIALILLGIIAITASSFTKIFSVVFLGILIAGGGLILMVDSFRFWWGRWNGFFFYFTISALYLVVGVLLIRNPIWGAVSLTAVLAIFYLALGIFRMSVSISIRLPWWLWSFFSGVLAFCLGFLILIGWTKSSLILLSLFVGLDLLFSGWPYVMIAYSSKRKLKKEMMKEVNDEEIE